MLHLADTEVSDEACLYSHTPARAARAHHIGSSSTYNAVRRSFGVGGNQVVGWVYVRRIAVEIP
jgi:hypothetical protein